MGKSLTWVATVGTPLLLTFTCYSALLGDEHSLLDSIKQAVARSATTSTSPLEIAFFAQIEENEGERDGHKSLGRWLIGEMQPKRDQQLKVLTCVYVFFGTSDSLEDVAVHSEQATPSQQSLIVLLRMPRSGEVPSAKVTAVVQVSEEEERRLYLVRKAFEYQNKRWVMQDSRVERK